MGQQIKQSEQEKVVWIVTNTVLNGYGHENYRLTEDPSMNKYNYWEEAMLWAKSKSYFPELSQEEFLIVARKYDVWNEFEDECFKNLNCKGEE